MSDEAIREKLEDVRSQIEMLAAIYDEAETDEQREAIKKQGVDLISKVAVNHMMAKICDQMLAMFEGQQFSHGAGTGGLLALKHTTHRGIGGEFVIPKRKSDPPA